MIIRLLLLIAFVVVVLIIRKQFKSTPKPERKKFLWKYGLSIGAIVLILLALTGRIHWIGAVIAALLPLARQALPMLVRFQWQHGRETSTATLHMLFDPDTQQLSGQVLAGPFAGQTLQSLGLEQLQLLLDYCQSNDPQSTNLLASYLNQRFGNQWQQQQSSGSSNLDAEEAYALLGLTPDTNREEIIQAHRKLMQKVHPDRGGNDYLAAKLNQAKDLLLKLHSH